MKRDWFLIVVVCLTLGWIGGFTIGLEAHRANDHRPATEAVCD